VRKIPVPPEQTGRSDGYSVSDSATLIKVRSYYLTVGTGLLASLAIILLAMPLLGRMTAPANARFE
jgi:hypothetical protein